MGISNMTPSIKQKKTLFNIAKLAANNSIKPNNGDNVALVIYNKIISIEDRHPLFSKLPGDIEGEDEQKKIQTGTEEDEIQLAFDTAEEFLNSEEDEIHLDFDTAAGFLKSEEHLTEPDCNTLADIFLHEDKDVFIREINTPYWGGSPFIKLDKSPRDIYTFKRVLQHISEKFQGTEVIICLNEENTSSEWYHAPITIPMEDVLLQTLFDKTEIDINMSRRVNGKFQKTTIHGLINNPFEHLSQGEAEVLRSFLTDRNIKQKHEFGIKYLTGVKHIFDSLPMPGVIKVSPALKDSVLNKIKQEMFHHLSTLQKYKQKLTLLYGEDLFDDSIYLWMEYPDGMDLGGGSASKTGKNKKEPVQHRNLFAAYENRTIKHPLLRF